MIRFASILRALAAAFLSAAIAACTSTGSVSSGPITLDGTSRIGKFVWHDLITDDVDTAKRFYTRLFGWTYEPSRSVNGRPYALIRSGDRYIGGIAGRADPADGRDYSRWIGYLSVPDVDVAASTARRAGGEIIDGPVDVHGIARAAAVRDPQGAVVGLLRSKWGDPDDADPRPGDVVFNELLAANDRAAATFYASLAGYRADAVARRNGHYVLLRAGGTVRAGILQRPSEEIQPLWLTHFLVDDPAGAGATAEKLGGRIILPASPSLREGSMAVVTDPTGALLALSRPQTEGSN
jgi:predicted enzyme related to lactoylglutathione lyase